jgi:hypothetical protein
VFTIGSPANNVAPENGAAEFALFFRINLVLLFAIFLCFYINIVL